MPIQMTPVMPMPMLMPQTQGGSSRHQVNSLYKTQVCKHFMNDNSCSKGNSCHYAHGDAELRRRNEDLPVEVKYKMMNVPYNNFKTQVCKYFEQTKQCHYGKNCTYAHGSDELR